MPLLSLRSRSHRPERRAWAALLWALLVAASCTTGNGPAPVPEGQVRVPYVTNSRLENVQRYLGSLGLDIDVDWEFATSHGAGDVVSQDPEAGSLVRKGSTVKVKVSTTPEKWTPAGEGVFSYGRGLGETPATDNEAQSKLFYTEDKKWWAALADSSAGQPGVYLYRLEKHEWKRDLLLPGSPPGAKADALLDEKTGTLYVALVSRGEPAQTAGTIGSFLYELSYQGSGRWKLESGPTKITDGGPEVLTIALDSSGRLWTTFEENEVINVGYFDAGSLAFNFSSIPGQRVRNDDIATVTSFRDRSGSKIGIMWSDQVTGRFRFAWRADSAPIDTPWNVETIYGSGAGCSAGVRCADDHVNIKAFDRHVYAVVKTGLSSRPSASPREPLIMLLRRNPRGSWRAVPISPVKDRASNPIVLIAPGLHSIYVFSSFQGVSMWGGTLDALRFDSDEVNWTSPGSTVPTSTKQLVGGTVGTVVLSDRVDSHEYWHNRFLAIPDDLRLEF